VDRTDPVAQLLMCYDPAAPRPIADGLRELWLESEPKSVAGIKAGQRQQQETVGTPIPVLRAIGREIGKAARCDVDGYLPLTRLLWEAYGREGRVVASIALGVMELVAPGTIMPLLMVLCRTCITWEDADRLAMDALEPIVRKSPERWLRAIDPWLTDSHKWVRRAGVTVAGRLPMVRADYTAPCLEMAARLLSDDDDDVRKSVSFAIRIAVRGDVGAVRDFLHRRVPPESAAATWVLCDVIRGMGRGFLSEFAGLLPQYERWSADPSLSARDRRSVESAVKVLQRVRP
jgi:hypothetical protein